MTVGDVTAGGMAAGGVSAAGTNDAHGSGSLGEFLRSRRAALDPEAAGVRSWGKRRRVPGLRREEVAQLAGVSAAYYVRLEQGAARNASNEVLLALARALALNDVETEHLMDLAQPRPGRAAPRSRPERPDPRSLAMLDALSDHPAVLLGRRNDVLAWTPLGHALLASHVPFDSTENPGTYPSLPRLLFLDPQVRGLYPDWRAEARTYIAYLRLISGKYPGDKRLAELVGELCMRDADFAALWAGGHVGECTSGTKRMRHPLVGELRVDYQIWLQADSPDHRLEVYTPADEPSADALALLASVSAPNAHDRTTTPPRRAARL
ncbi:helix-turn-helix domain-containing protein [Promicromonospora sukumoe]|uniref:Transcriptional regulator with XRE-family HTH domain n=1 Tax=Promicromonospora sukumoe TaxID=88382 RepID=A0A7W3PDM9_9MICO|nr:helix-turn-helix transcriptional regulator [Promicromonospora sukumoe]MBA8807911.1 transcriptional regulator with XRE-family HTH domain [Promicromonospora sukumoe]